MVTDPAVREDLFRHDGVDYFRSRASTVQLGDLGERQTRAGSFAHLAVQARLPRERLPIERVACIDLNGAVVRGSDIAVDVEVAEVGSLGASTVARLLRDRSLCLVKLEATPSAVIAAANDCAEALQHLGRAGRAGRLVHQVLVVVEAATADALARCARWTLDSAAGEACVLSGFAVDGGRTAVPLAPGATFAYRLLTPTWLGERIAGAECDPVASL